MPAYVVDLESYLSYKKFSSRIHSSKLPPVSGVYEIKNIQNGRSYIGFSTNVLQRLSSHRMMLRANVNHCIKMQKDYNLFREENFVFRVLQVVDDESYEKVWIDRLGSKWPLGYNTRELPNSNKGNACYITKESAAKISRAHKGKIPKNLSYIQQKQATRVAAYDGSELIGVFSSQRQAATELGIDFRRINANLKRGLNIKTHPNITFKYC